MLANYIRAGVLVLLASPTAHAELAGRERELLKIAFPFNLCVRQEADSLAARNPSKNMKSDSQALGNEWWAKSLEKCEPHMNEDERLKILSQYGGNSSPAHAFVDGVVLSARSYVISLAIDHAGKK